RVLTTLLTTLTLHDALPIQTGAPPTGPASSPASPPPRPGCRGQTPAGGRPPLSRRRRTAGGKVPRTARTARRRRRRSKTPCVLSSRGASRPAFARAAGGLVSEEQLHRPGQVRLGQRPDEPRHGDTVRVHQPRLGDAGHLVYLAHPLKAVQQDGVRHAVALDEGAHQPF